jgi:hypothetical protein
MVEWRNLAMYAMTRLPLLVIAAALLLLIGAALGPVFKAGRL